MTCNNQMSNTVYNILANLDPFTQLEIINKLDNNTKFHMLLCDTFAKCRKYVNNIIVPEWFTDDDLIKFPYIKYLSCGNNQNITDLGIQSLSNLILLFCVSNRNITDVGLSKLINLTTFSCGCSRGITNLGIKNLSNLETLDCSENTNLSNECLINLTNLKRLECGSNINFTNEGISNLTNLEILDIGHNNNFTDEKICQMPKLKSLYHFSHKISKVSDMLHIIYTNLSCMLLCGGIGGLKYST